MKRNCSSWSCFALAAIFVLSLTLAACDDDDPPAVNSLAFTGTGYTPHTGQTIRVAVVNSSTSAVVATDSVLVPADGTFSFAFTGVLARGVAYNLDYYADSNLGAGSGLDGNGVCDAPPLDHAWRVVIPAVGGNVTVAEVHNTSFTNVCASFPPTGFNLTFTGGGYTPHSGQTLRVAVVNSSTLAVVATDSVLLPADGTFSFTFTGFLMQGVAYNLDYYADSDAGAGSGIDGNGVCDAPGTDHAWRVAIPAPTAAVVQAETHNTTFTNVCASFP